jgi:spore germination protein YaaH
MKTLRNLTFKNVNNEYSINMSIESTNAFYHFFMKKEQEVVFHEKCKTSKALCEIIENYRCKFYNSQYDILVNIAKCLNDL